MRSDDLRIEAMPVRLVRTSRDGVPVYGHAPMPGWPAVGALRLSDLPSVDGIPPARPHTHDFFIVSYFERDGGSLRVGTCELRPVAGDVVLLAPGDRVTVVGGYDRITSAGGRAVHFSVEAIGPAEPGTLLSWRSHPLLFPFGRATAGAVKRLHVPAADRLAFLARIEDLAGELAQRRHGHDQAVRSKLTLLLIDIARLTPEATRDDRIDADPLLVGVLTFIDLHFQEGISLRDVARAVHLSPGHLTTVVRHRSGRTVQEWITERRLAEARRLLLETDLAIDEVGRRSGFQDPSFFARTFRRGHGESPRGWRRAARTEPGLWDGAPSARSGR